jgi:hypothetical protein
MEFSKAATKVGWKIKKLTARKDRRGFRRHGREDGSGR